MSYWYHKIIHKITIYIIQAHDIFSVGQTMIISWTNHSLYWKFKKKIIYLKFAEKRVNCICEEEHQSDFRNLWKKM